MTRYWFLTRIVVCMLVSRSRPYIVLIFPFYFLFFSCNAGRYRKLLHAPVAIRTDWVEILLGEDIEMTRWQGQQAQQYL